MMRTALMMLLMSLSAGNASAALIQGPLENVWREVNAATHIQFGISGVRFSDIKDSTPEPTIEAELNNEFGNGFGLAGAVDLPLVTAVAHAHYTADFSGGMSAVANAKLAFSVAVDSRFGEPDTLGQVPVTIAARWRVSSDPIAGSAKVAATFDLPGIQDFEAKVLSGLFSDSESGSLTQSALMNVGSIVHVTMEAQASATATYLQGTFVHPFTTADAFASLDPVFAFDQAAFDAERTAAGLESFKLEDVYQFVFSPGIQNFASPSLVPLPNSLFMLLSGMMAVLVGGAQRRRCCA